MNPDPNCEKDCRFRISGGVTTCMYFEPVYDKHGNNVNPDGNTTTGTIQCDVCNRWWQYKTQYSKTTFTEMTG